MTTRYLNFGALVLLVIAAALLPVCSSKDSGNPVNNPVHYATDFFVSVNSGDDGNSGKLDEPFAMIQRAIDTAALTGGRVFVAEGTYYENVVLAKGVSIFGGYKDSTFVRDAAAVTTINGTNVAVNVTNADTLTIDGFTIKCADATTPGGSSIGISLSDSRGVTITHNTIHTGNGAAGLNRAKSAARIAACDGDPGLAATNDGCDLLGCPIWTPGGLGGYLPDTNVGGGIGGWSNVNSWDGFAGSGASGGTGGVGKGLLGGHGGDGGNGGAGINVGANGSGGAAFGSAPGYAYLPSEGTSGGNGQYGSGGGGGGGGGGILAKGGSGGGGGAGAKGGLPGLGGGAGGASIAIVLTGNSQATISNNSIMTGNGGAGGAGAPGGNPGTPGTGGAGGAGNGWGSAGGKGGNGGAGKAGGAGGGGGGGSSIGIFEAASSSTTLANNSIILSPAGPGGSSPGHKGADGQALNYLKL